MFKSLCLIVLILLPVSESMGHGFSIQVVDEAGRPITDYEIMWHTDDKGYSLWSHQRSEYWGDGPRLSSGSVVDLIVRAHGYASKVQRFEGDSLRALSEGSGKIVLERGKEVTIEARNLSSAIPKDFNMESFFPEFKGRVHSMWQPDSIRDNKPDWNMLNVRQIDDTHFSARISKNTKKFFLAFQHPGWLQFSEFGPFSADVVMTDGIKLAMPNPARINVTFDPGNKKEERLFKSANCSIYWAPDESGSNFEVKKAEISVDEISTMTIDDLGPGKYRIEVQTNPDDPNKVIEGTEINPGQFFDRDNVEIESGQSKDVIFHWTPFDPESYRGNVQAELSIANGDGTIPFDRNITVSWFDGHYGIIKIFEGSLPETGIILLDGISGVRQRGSAPFGSYQVSIDGSERLGFFRTEDSTALQRFRFKVTPKAGDVAPLIRIRSIETQQILSLSDFSGQNMLLEFWATWCGPCQPAMEKLNALAADMPDNWKNKIALISLSTDRETDVVSSHTKSRGWNDLRHFAVVRGEGQYFSDAEQAYVLHGVPEAILIDKEGIIRWRGHPSKTEDGKTLIDRINELISD